MARINRYPIPVVDLGLQPERTALSWTRTALAMFVASLTLLRWSATYSALVFGAIGLLCCIALVIIARNRAQYRTGAEGIKQEQVRANVFGVFAITIGMAMFAAIGLFLVLDAG